MPACTTEADLLKAYDVPTTKIRPTSRCRSRPLSGVSQANAAAPKPRPISAPNTLRPESRANVPPASGAPIARPLSAPHGTIYHGNRQPGASGFLSLSELRNIATPASQAWAPKDFSPAQGASAAEQLFAGHFPAECLSRAASAPALKRRRPSTRKRYDEQLRKQRLARAKGGSPSKRFASVRDDSQDESDSQRPHSPETRAECRSPVGSGPANQGPRQRRQQSGSPFLDFDSREQRAQMERRLLQQDPTYMKQRQAELRHEVVMRRLNADSIDPDRMYENSQFYNDYAVKIRLGKTLKEESRRLHEEKGVMKELVPMRIQRLRTARQSCDAHNAAEDSDLNAFPTKSLATLNKSLIESHDRLVPPKVEAKPKYLEGLTFGGLGLGKRPTASAWNVEDT